MGFTLIKKQTISSSQSSIDFINGTSDVVFDSTYTTYMFLCENLTGSGGELPLYSRVTTDGSTWDAIYGNFEPATPRTYADGAFTTTDHEGQLNNNYCQIGAFAGSMSEATLSLVLYFFAPASTSKYKLMFSNLTGIGDNSPAGHWLTYGQFGNFTWKTTSAITGVRFYENSGTLEGGDISLFGLKTS